MYIGFLVTSLVSLSLRAVHVLPRFSPATIHDETRPRSLLVGLLGHLYSPFIVAMLVVIYPSRSY